MPALSVLLSVFASWNSWPGRVNDLWERFVNVERFGIALNCRVGRQKLSIGTE